MPQVALLVVYIVGIVLRAASSGTRGILRIWGPLSTFVVPLTMWAWGKLLLFAPSLGSPVIVTTFPYLFCTHSGTQK